jgi:hypothetical protein
MVIDNNMKNIIDFGYNLKIKYNKISIIIMEILPYIIDVFVCIYSIIYFMNKSLYEAIIMNESIIVGIDLIRTCIVSENGSNNIYINYNKRIEFDMENTINTVNRITNMAGFPFLFHGASCKSFNYKSSNNSTYNKYIFYIIFSLFSILSFS